MPLSSTSKTRGSSVASKTHDEDDLDVRSRLLRAADQILKQEGIHALTQTRVAKAADLRQSHLTYYFPTRSELVRAVVETTAVDVVTEITRDPDRGTVTLSRLRERVIKQLSDLEMGRRLFGIMVAIDEDPALLKFMDELETRIIDSMLQALNLLGLNVSRMEVALLHVTLVGIAVRNLNRGSEDAKRQTRCLLRAAFDRMANVSTEVRH